MILFVIIAVLVEILLTPRIDFKENILWYGSKNKRKYIQL
jgi:hypothetical protein